MESNDVTVNKILHDFRESLASTYEPEEAARFAYLLFEAWKGWSRAQVHMNGKMILTREEAERFLDALGQLRENKPIQYIIGETIFLNAKIRVRKGVLIPRPETEEMAAMILRDYRHRQYENLSMLDIGTGSGCIPIAIKKEMPGTDISATDISPAALKIAEENASLNKCPVTFILSDILDRGMWKNFPGYTVIISNPPYVTEHERPLLHPNVTGYEPHEALFVSDEDPLQFYKVLAEFAFLHLVRPGSLYLEINEKYGKQVKDLLLSRGFDKAEVLKDIQGKDRFVVAEAKTTMLDTSYWNVEH